MLSKFRIRNFKSILDESIELGAFNVFIGQNGCGKTNILEAVAMAAAAVSGRLSTEDLFLRGMRIARPTLMASSFEGRLAEGTITLDIGFKDENYVYKFSVDDPKNFGSAWNCESEAFGTEVEIMKILYKALNDKELLKTVLKHAKERDEQDIEKTSLKQYSIFAPSTNTLRGLEATSRQEPIGLYGENLDVALSRISGEQRDQFNELLNIVDWVDNYEIDPSDKMKFDGLKLGRSTSRLYFTDRFMHPDNRTFSAENANEGILHVLFHLALFLVPGTPNIFAIDNIEAALNPGMCRRLIEVLAKLAIEKGKQAWVTTHNPAILDGLNLHDDQQRLFVVYRNEEGHTKVRRIRMKPNTDPGHKLSELWLRGHLGALPQGF